MIGVSVDVDSIAAHLRGYGRAVNFNCNDPVYCTAIPRLLEVFDRQGIKATFFFIADEAKEFPDIVKEIACRGHEIASHSMTHQLLLNLNDPETVRRELFLSKTLLEEISGTDILGFRAPSWSYSPELIDVLAKAGYLYDASLFPSALMALYRLQIVKRSQNRISSGGSFKILLSSLRLHFKKASITTIKTVHGNMTEIPVTTVPLLRFPVYHTFAYVMPLNVFKSLITVSSVRKVRQYVLHASDFLSFKDDRLDPDIKCHPGMSLPLKEKVGLIEDLLAFITEREQSVPLKNLCHYNG
ncbi:MAG: hypothetical protein D6719_02515 [Candidatus Dadabacteria bacterium]|nr:MAG: hypothetical protein D6719_02515 [Candidatus Dadabacteria bacterium]